MKCFNHTDVEAVATCVDCGKSLCKECASKYEPILCDSCAAARQARHNAGIHMIHKICFFVSTSFFLK